MLTEIRDRSSGWLAWVIALLIIIPMAFWGVQDYASSSATPSIVSIGDTKITQAQFQARLNQEQQYMRQVMGAQVNNSLLNSESFKSNVLRQMMNRELIENLADDANYQIGDEQLAKLIKENDLFKKDGKFDQDAYNRYVVQSQYSRTQFEEELRKQNRITQVTSGYTESALALTDEIKQILEWQAQQRTFDLVTVRRSDQQAEVSADQAEIEEYYNNNQSQYMQPEQMSVNYLRLSVDDLLSEVELDEDEIKAIYEDNKESYTTGERRETRHILLKTSSDASSDDIEDQRKKATELAEKLRNGDDFAELATANSQDPGSAKNGGSLGLVSRGQMVSEFEEATFSLAENEISDPIKTQFGFHVIQVQKIQPSVIKAFEEVRFDIEEGERERIAEELLIERADLLRDLAYEQPDNLDYAAEQLSLKVQESELFERNNGTGVASSGELRDVAFSEEVLVDGNNSTPLELTDGEYVVIRKAQHKPSEPRPLADVQEQISTVLKNEKATELAKKKGEELLAKAKENWATATENESLEVSNHTVSLIDTNRTVNNDILEQVNKLQLEGDEPVVTSVLDAFGDYHVVRLTKVEAGDLSKVGDQAKDSARRLIERRNGNTLFSNYLENLLEKEAPQINEELL